MTHVNKLDLILQENLQKQFQPLVHDVKQTFYWFMQQDNDAKHTSNLT